MITPDEFIPIAEESGIIIDIGKFVIKEACRIYKKWSDNMKTKIKMSVNFSSMQFLESNFVDSIIKVIDEFILNPSFLIIEITENILINKFDKVISDIKRLQSYGIQIALDDFGTGYSSLAYLSSFNIDILKIDGSFVKKLMTDKTSNVITKSIINMAQELNIKLVVEGIENWEQLTYLRGLNCFAGQGYIYSKPIELENFEKLLIKGRCNPVNINYDSGKLFEDRRKYFRINFYQLLEADMTIINISGKNINVGNTKVLIKNMGPGGLSYISNIKLPIEKDINLLFLIQLLNKEMKIYGKLIWVDELHEDLYEYGVEFAMDENERGEIVRILNLVQIKMRKDILFAEGNFITESPFVYFNNVN